MYAFMGLSRRNTHKDIVVTPLMSPRPAMDRDEHTEREEEESIIDAASCPESSSQKRRAEIDHIHMRAYASDSDPCGARSLAGQKERGRAGRQVIYLVFACVCVIIYQCGRLLHVHAAGCSYLGRPFLFHV